MTLIVREDFSIDRCESLVERATTQPKAPAAALFVGTLLFSSSLLFLVQPMFAKMVLPRLGGTPAVWNTCMVFFQACLLAGYGYAHVLTGRFSMRTQVMVHACVLALPIVALPIALPADLTASAPNGSPILWLLKVLALSVGLPFFAVASTAPLIQKWFGATTHRHARDPYFLYAASNIGSMTALLAYPSAIEPLLRLGTQSHVWADGYVAFALLVICCGARCAVSASSNEKAFEATATAQTAVEWNTRLRWVLLSAIPSSYLLGVTTFITTDVAALPLLWILPLALYLLTFILVFARRPIVSHRAFVFLLPAAVLAPVLLIVTRSAMPVWVGVSVHCFAFFIAAMVCHGELVRLRPASKHLTEFYLMMSVGGVLGGMFNALAAPFLFSRPLEYPLAIVLACLICPPRALYRAAASQARVRRSWNVVVPLIVGAIAWTIVTFVSAPGRPAGLTMLAMAVPILICIACVHRSQVRFTLAVTALLLVAMFAPVQGAQLLEIHRTFFGIHRVVRSRDGRFNELFHGTTLHGREIIASDGEDEPLTYYHHDGPLGSLFAALPSPRRKKVAIIGLGVGSIAAYATAGDSYSFFEIDPAVAGIAGGSGYFHFLSSARARGATVQVTLGDARLTLSGVPHGAMNLVVLDAFSGDAIPIHLLTREALAMYLDKLDEQGILAVHISNLYLDLEPVVARLAQDAGCVALSRQDLDLSPAQWSAGKTASKWMLIARRDQDLAAFEKTKGWQSARVRPSSSVWTDDFSNVLSTLR